MKRKTVRLSTDPENGKTRIEYMGACIVVDVVDGSGDYHGGNCVYGFDTGWRPVFGVSGVAVMDLRNNPSIGWDKPWNE